MKRVFVVTMSTAPTTDETLTPISEMEYQVQVDNKTTNVVVPAVMFTADNRDDFVAKMTEMAAALWDKAKEADVGAVSQEQES